MKAGLLAGRKAAGGGGEGPEAVTWDHYWWAEGSEFAVEGYSDTDVVDSWPDEIATADMANANSGSQPTYQATSNINSQPAVRFDQTDDYLLWTPPSTVSQPFSVVLVADASRTGGNYYFWDTASAGGGSRTLLIAGTQWQMFAGSSTVNTGFTANTNNHLFVCYFNGSSSLLELDGTTGTTISPGTSPMVGMHLNRRYNGGNNLGYDLAFMGFVEGDARSDGGWGDFEAWVSDHYGITIS